MQRKKTREKILSDMHGNLIEYFYLFGIEPYSINFENFNENEKFLQVGFLRPKLLSRFPPNEKGDISVNEKIIKSHCFPNGFALVKKNEPINEEYFYFSLENMIGINTYDKILHFSCVIFYEPLTKYKQIKNVKNNESKKEYPIDNIYAPKVLCISSYLTFPNEFKILLKKLINYSKLEKITYPIEKIIENMVYGIPRPPRAFFNIECKKKSKLFPKQDFDIEFRLPALNECYSNSYRFQTIFIFSVDDILEIYKCLLLEVPILFFSSQKELLSNVFETFMTLLHPFKYQNPHIAILPNINAGIIEMTKSFAFGINHKWEIPGNKERKGYFQKFNLNIINKKILICDIDSHKIYRYCNCNPIYHIVNFNDLGNYENYDEDDPLSTRSKDINSDCFNNWSEYNLPVHYTKKLKKKLKTFLEDNKNLNFDVYNPKINRELLEDTFYYYLVSLFQSYNDYIFKKKKDVDRICLELLSKNLNDIKIETLFNAKGFASFTGENFYAKFVETNIFKEFLKRKYLLMDEDKYTILHFDESILEKINKYYFYKKDTKIEFKKSKSIKISHKYKVKQTNIFNEEEYKYIKEHKDGLLKYYQQYNDNNSFSYLIFPKFLYDNNFFEKIYQASLFYDDELYKLIEDSNKAIDELQKSKIFSIYNSDFTNLYLFDIKSFEIPMEIENSLYLLWINIFCLTLYYCNEKEKEYRYEEMMDHLSRITLEKDKAIYVIISTLEKYGSDALMINFFENLSSYSYSIYAFFTNKFLSQKNIIPDLQKISIVNSKPSISFFHESEIDINIIESAIHNNQIINLKPRTFDVDNCPLKEIELKNEMIVFDDIATCENCQKSIELALLTINFNEMNKGALLKCPECSHLFTPKINVQFGENIEYFNLYGVYYLYKLSFDLIKLYGHKLNIDDLRIKYKEFFWNCIWYFGIKGLSYDMMLKYKFINYYSLVNNNKTTKKINKFSNLEFQKQSV